MSQITGEKYQMMNAARTVNRFPITVMEAVLGLNSYLQDQFGALADIYMPIEGISENKLNQEFVYRKTPNTIKAKALTLDKIKGKTLAWNQLIRNGNFANGTTNWNAWSASKSSISATNGVLTQTFTPDGGSAYEYGLVQRSVMQVQSHIYMLMLDVKTTTRDARFTVEFGGSSVGSFMTTAGQKQRVAIKNTRAQYNEQLLIYPQSVPTESFTVEYSNIILVDLTLLGRKDMTAQEFEALYPDAYYPYNPGDLISNDAESLETVGFNKWDEEWEFGFIDSSGVETTSDISIRSKNYIYCFPDTDYYLQKPVSVLGVAVKWYDGNKNFISTSLNGVIHSPANARFFRVSCYQYGTTYNHDICINLSDPAKNGQYEPYKKSVCQLNLKTRTGKLNGQGASVVVFPDGMNGVGTSFDEANKVGGTKRRARVNLGDLDWAMQISSYSSFVATVTPSPKASVSGSDVACRIMIASGNLTAMAISSTSSSGDNYIYISTSGNIVVKATAYTDAATFKAAMDGVYLDYELAEPKEYVWDEPLPTSMPAGTTEARISPNADGLSAPFCCDITYGMGATEYAETAGVASFALNAQYAEVAARLLTPKTIWGQTFDGTQNVSGAMTGVSAIDSLMYFDTSNGRIGIGISTPLYSLDVAGTFRATGNSLIGGTLGVTGKLTGTTAEFNSIIPADSEYDSEHSINIPLWRLEEDGEAEFGETYIRGLLKLRAFYYDDGTFHDATMQYEYDDEDASNCFISADKSIHAPSFVQSSDIRLKTDLQPIALTVEQVASAPAVEFNWIGNGQRGAGSIAQYWEEQLPYNVHHSGDTLTMEYGNIALISAIVCARKIQELEEQVKELKEIINNK